MAGVIVKFDPPHLCCDDCNTSNCRVAAMREAVPSRHLMRVELSSKARKLIGVLAIDPELAAVSFMVARGWIVQADQQPWTDWNGFVERCRAKARKVDR